MRETPLKQGISSSKISFSNKTKDAMFSPLLTFSLLILFFLLIIPSQQQIHLSSFNISNSPWLPSQNQILVSPNFKFAAGFLSQPSNSTSTYIFSIWSSWTTVLFNLSAATTVIWSANHRSPISPTGALSITNSGNLFLSSSTSGTNLWPTKPTGNPNSTALTLLNDGSLIYSNWSSFLNPTNTFLTNQTINGTELESNNARYKYINSRTLIYNQTRNYYDSGNSLLKLDDYGKLIQDNGASAISSDFVDTNKLRRLTLEDDGNLYLYSLDLNLNTWVIVWQAVQEICRIPGLCGANAICMNDGFKPIKCVCPPGFESSNNSTANGGTNGCRRKIQMMNLKNTKFLQLDFVNFSGYSDQRSVSSVNLADCGDNCSSESKCVGFGFKFQDRGYCVLQFNNLENGYWSPGSEVTFFLRVDGSETDRSNFTGLTSLIQTTCPVNISLPFPPAVSDTTTRNIIIIVTLFAAEFVGGALFCWPFLKKFQKYRDMAQTLGLELLPTGGPKRFTYSELKAATKDFSDHVGKGGFGDVYRGELIDHRIIAVKCLKNGTGGDTEFWAEVTIVARMHHLNLVRLWGYCAEKGKRILVYEYVPNGSLDKYLFPKSVSSENRDADTNTERKPILDWTIRYRISLGVARAVAYLHEECLEWVLHCDIKPENILLGDDFCPKISDFGLAKLKNKEDKVSMSKIRGTRGYMAPEWTERDPITAKADVYSFGMVLLEMVTGSRNFDKRASEIGSAEWYFPRWAFDRVFKEMRVEDILDDRIKHSYDSRAHFDMVNRMVKTAMWCLQDRPDLRPSMGKVAKMLEGTIEITEPRKPTIFYLENE